MRHRPASGAPLSRWFQHSGPLTEDYADSGVEAAVGGLRRDADSRH